MEPYQELERRLADWCGVPNVVGCASGTAALHLGLETLRLPLGSKVIVPTFTMIACPRAVTLAGLVPVFVDCTDDLLLDMDLVDEACSHAGGDVRAVMPVHIYGRAVAMNELAALAKKHDLYMVEDLAEAHGVRPHPDTFAAAWSFYKNKCIAGEEGGAVAFGYRWAADLARMLRSLGFTPEHNFTHLPRGWNHRLSNLHAAPILESLTRFPYNFLARRNIEEWYNAACPDEWRMPFRLSPWVYDLRVPGLTRERQGRVVRELNAAGIAARHSFLPMHLQQEYRTCRRFGGENAERLAGEVFYLPIVPGIQPGKTTESLVSLAFDVIRRALR